MGILKSDWERYREPAPLSIEEIRTLIAVVSNDSIKDLELMPAGCANTNYKISFTSHPPVVMRLYTREPAALLREVHIYRLLKDLIPMARMLHADASQKVFSYPFAFFSYVEGILLRDLIFSGDEKAISTCTFEAGLHLATLNSFTFLEGGFFDDKFHVRPFKKNEAYLNFILGLLKNSTVKRDVRTTLIDRIRTLVRNEQYLLSPPNPACLTHGDFDPSNIKVMQTNGSWHISAILDWEFSFAGSSLLDIGTMLRYSHKLSPCFETSFIKGIRAGGMELLPSWKKIAKMMDILCLLQIIHSNPQRRRPIINRDAIELIEHTLNNWESFS